MKSLYPQPCQIRQKGLLVILQRESFHPSGRCLSQESPCLTNTNPSPFPYNPRFTNGHWEQRLTESETSNSCLGWFDSKATNQSAFSPILSISPSLQLPQKIWSPKKRQTVNFLNVHNLRSKKLFCRIRPSIPLGFFSGRSWFFFLLSKCPSPKSSPRWAALKVTKRLGKTSSCSAMWEDIVWCFLQLPVLPSSWIWGWQYAGSPKGTDRLRGIPVALRSTEPYWSCTGKTWSFQSTDLTRLLGTYQSMSATRWVDPL